MKILAYNNQALSIDGKGIYIENLSALAENGSLIKIVTPIVNKGDLVYLDVDGKGDKLYRVLKCRGDVAMVMAMYDDLTSAYNSTSTTTTFGSTTAQKYEGSTLDTYLNTTWYNTLSSTVKNAIVPENVVQYCYQYYDEPNTPNTPTYTYQYQYDWSNSDYENANNVGNVTVGERNVFALDLKDIFDYIGKVCITSDELMTMFWNSTTKVSKYPWLRSSSAGDSGFAWYVFGSDGDLYYADVSRSYVVRPAFNINLSQVPFTKKKGETWVINDTYSSDADFTASSLNFISNGENFTSITIRIAPVGSTYIKYNNTTVNNIYVSVSDVGSIAGRASWINSAYRTVTFLEPPTGDLLTWLQANAVKQ